MKIEDFPPIFDAAGKLTAFGITVKKLMLEILADDCKHELNWICVINEGDEECCACSGFAQSSRNSGCCEANEYGQGRSSRRYGINLLRLPRLTVRPTKG